MKVIIKMTNKICSEQESLISPSSFGKWVFWIIFAGAIYRLFFVAHFYGGDEVSYFHTMSDLLRENIITTPNYSGRNFSLYYMRLFVYIPSLLCLKFFGSSYTATLIPVFVYSLGTIFLIMVVAKRLYSPTVGVIAGAILASLPLFSLYSTVFTPDVPVTFFITASWVSFVMGLQEDNKKKNLWWFVLAGIMTHMAFSIKEPGILLLGGYFLFALFVLRFSNGGIRVLLIIGVSFLVSFLIMGIFFYIFTCQYWYQTIFFGDPLGLKKVISHKRIREFIPFYLTTPIEKQVFIDYIREYTVYFNMLFQKDSTFGFYGALFVFGGLHFLFFNKNKTRGTLLIIYVSVFIFAYFNFGSPTLHKYTFLPKSRRYLLPLIPPMAIMSAVMIERFIRNNKFKYVVYTMLIAVFIHGVYIANGFSRYLVWGQDLRNWIGAVENVPNYRNTPIYVAGNIVEHLRLFVDPAKGARLHDISEIWNGDGTSNLKALQGSYLIYNDGYYYWRRKTSLVRDKIILKEFNSDFFEYVKELTPWQVCYENSTPIRDLLTGLGAKNIIGTLGKREGESMERHKVFIYRLTHVDM